MIHQFIKRVTCNFSIHKVPIIDIESFLKNQLRSQQDCKKVANSLRDYGCLIIKDPRVNQQQNSTFLDMMEKYFHKRSSQFYAGNKLQDFYPQYDYEIGITPQNKQILPINQNLIKSFIGQNKSLTPYPTPLEAKWRFLWNIGESEDNIPNQSPKDFPQGENVMNTWGNHMINGCMTVAQMAAIGMNLQKDTFSNLLINGPHKLAPTGSNLEKFDVGTVFSGFHQDFNFLTIHGKSRYPGLFIWLKSGQKLTISVPQGHLLLQAGSEFEYVTGGFVKAGYHEVIYTQQVKQAKQKAIKQGRIPWRVSSTLFSHLRYNEILKPLGRFATQQAIKKYPQIKVKDFVESYFDQRKRNV